MNLALTIEDVKELFLEAFEKSVKNSSPYAKWTMPTKHLVRRGTKKQFGDANKSHLRIGSISTSEYLQSSITNGIAELIIVDDKSVSEFMHVIDVINFLQTNVSVEVTLTKHLTVIMCKDGIVKVVTKDFTADNGKRLILIVDKTEPA